MKKNLLLVGLMCAFALGNAHGQSWKKAGAIVSGVTAVITGIAATAVSNSDANDVQSHSNSKSNYEQIQDEFFAYLIEYQANVESKKNFGVEDIKQPYAKELILKILENEELVAEIDEAIEGDSILAKINIVLLAELQ